jgi:hypothetical protein
VELAQAYKKVQKETALFEYKLRELMRFVGKELNTDLVTDLKMWEAYENGCVSSTFPIDSLDDYFEKRVSHENG